MYKNINLRLSHLGLAPVYELKKVLNLICQAVLTEYVDFILEILEDRTYLFILCNLKTLFVVEEKVLEKNLTKVQNILVIYLIV